MLCAILCCLILTQLCIITGAERTVCEHEDSTVLSSTLFYYQRIELSDAVECLERCIENMDYCKAVLFIHDNNQKKGHHNYCQFYGVNSVSLGKEIRSKTGSKSTQRTTLYELLEKCAPNKAESSILKQLSPPARRAMKLFTLTANENGKKVKSVSSAAEFSVKDPLFQQHRNKIHRDEIPVNDPFSTQPTIRTNGLEAAKENIMSPVRPHVLHSEFSFSSPSTQYNPNKAPSAFLDDSHGEFASSDPVPIQPVVVSRGGFASSSFASAASSSYSNGPCPNGNCERLGSPPKYSNQFQSVASRFISAGKIPCAGRPGTNDPCAPPKPPSVWSEWSTAGECSVNCGKGVRKRTRYCNGPKQEDCKGESTKEEPCQNEDCNQWSEWTEWSLCSVTCGGGEKSRERTCRNGKDCDGAAKDTAQCGEQECPQWAAWSAWETCSTTCGKGTQQRHRECDPRGEDCSVGFSTEEKSCGEQKACPQWSTWQQWTECSKSCGGGERIRKRECMNGGDERDCPGPAAEHLPCSTQNCPSWNEWSGWSQCSTTCGNEGSKLRQRECRYEGLPSTQCTGPAQDQSACQQEACPRWSKWSTWSPCTASCGHGQQQRNRDCEPRGYGCEGGDREIRFCQLAVCPYYDQWSEWGGCSVSCGVGTCERHRRCHKDDPLPGAVLPSEEKLGAATGGGGALESPEGSDESDEKKESAKKDSSDDNPVSAKESNDSSNEEDQEAKKAHLIERAKSQTEEKASQEKRLRLREHILQVAQSSSTYIMDRRRSPIRTGVDSPFTDERNGCVGPDMERKPCDAGPCCDWSSWASWATCQARCGSGTRTRSRSCNIIPVSVSSFNSVFTSTFQRSSSANFAQNNRRSAMHNNARRPQRQVSPQNGYAFPNFMNTNTQYRPFPQYAVSGQQSGMGCNCPGRAMEEEQCSAAAVAGNDNCRTSSNRQRPQFDDPKTSSLTKCFWRSWAEWSQCSGTCSKGTRSRERECIKHSTECNCVGEDFQTERCGPKHCNAMEGHEKPVVKISMKAPVEEEIGSRKVNIKEEETDYDPVLSCYWSDWTEWGVCGKDSLKQRTRLCVGLKALINNCECMGASMEQTSCPFDKVHVKTFTKSTPTSILTTQQTPREVLRKRVDKMFTTEVERVEVAASEKVFLQPNIIRNGGNEDTTPLTSLDKPQFDEVLLKEESDADRQEKKTKSPESCDWNDWTTWTECSAHQCGQEGEKIRNRTCPCSSCPGGITQESESCYNSGCSA